jgi:methionine synthase II (cobalamin-independent)
MVTNTARTVLRDAVMVLLKVQDMAGLDLVTDGELMRFDPNNPETNGMVDYFVSRMSGIRKEFTLSDFDRFPGGTCVGLQTLDSRRRDRAGRRGYAESAKRL